MRIPILLRILILVLLAAVAYFWATALMDSLYTYRSPLASLPPRPGQAGLSVGESAPARRVVYVLIDGLRIDTALDAQIMPYLGKIRSQGAWAVMHSQPTSYSQTGYATLFTGGWPDISDGGLINLDAPQLFTWTQDNLFSAARRAGLTTAIAAHEVFRTLIPSDALTASYFTPRVDVLADGEVIQAALPWIEDGGYDLVVIHLDQVDYAGHYEGGPLDPRWKEAARRTDDLLGEIASRLDLSKDVLFVSSDHGHIDAGGHGGDEEIVLQQPFALIGARVRPGDYGDVQMVDVAPTLAALLGANLPATSQGQVLQEMLELSENEQAMLDQATLNQQETLSTAYLDAIGFSPSSPTVEADLVSSYQQLMQDARQQRLNREMAPRFLLALGVLILPLIWMVKRLRSELFWLIGGAVLTILVFHLRYSLMNGRTYSLSTLTSADEIISYVAVTVFMAGIVGWVAALLDRGVFRLPTSSAVLWSLNLSLVTIWLVSIPLMWSFVLNGVTISWTVPDWPSMFHGFLALLQILFIALLGIVLAGVTAITAWYQGRKLAPLAFPGDKDA